MNYYYIVLENITETRSQNEPWLSPRSDFSDGRMGEEG